MRPLRSTWSVCAVATLLILSLVAVSAKDLETTHLFGFTLGSDTNDVGEKEAELETTGRFAKRAGSYAAYSQAVGVKVVPVENFTIEPVVSFARHDISGVPGLDDRNRSSLEALSFEMRYRVLDRSKAPVGLTFGADVHRSRIEEVTGQRADGYGSEFLVIADRELLPDRLFAALNLIYAPEAMHPRATGVWEHQSGLTIAAAMTAQVKPGVLIGVETRYLRSYDGLGLDRLSGQALYIGPTFYAKLSERYWVAAAWNVQVSGRSPSDSGSLDLVNFERHQAKLRLGMNF